MMDCLDHWNSIVNRGAMDALLSCGEMLHDTPMDLRPTVASKLAQTMYQAGQVDTKAHGFWVLTEAYCEVVLRKQLEWFTTVLQECQASSDKRYPVNSNQQNVKRVGKSRTIAQQLTLFQGEPQ